MQQLTEHQIQQKLMVKAARKAIRLKHSLAADAETYRRLPELERKIDDSLLRGKPLTIGIDQMLKEFGESK